MRIGIIGPSEREILPFITQISNKSISEYAMLKFYSGVYEGVDVVSVFCGVCKVIILTGVAGALSGQLAIGDIVISSEVAYHDVARGVLTEYHPWMEDIYFRPDIELLKLCENISKSLSILNKCHIGRIITGEAFITKGEKERLIENFNPLCVDMESAGVAHTCYVNNIPFIVIRSISDNADEKGSETFKGNIEMVALNSIRLVEALIKRVGIS
jgi:adenosylhomocysteine nucleosidase